MQLHLSPSGEDTACAELGMKAVVVDNEFANGQQQTDFVTSYDLRGDFAAAHGVMTMQVEQLTARGLTVVREKIETTLDNPIVAETKQRSDTYFENHISFFLLRDKWSDRLALIDALGPERALLFSQPRYEDKPNLTWGTLRRYNVDLKEFEAALADVELALGRSAIYLIGHTEYACYDSNREHDLAWQQSYAHV